MTTPTTGPSTPSRVAAALPANRVAALAAFLTGIAASIAGIEGALPSSWADGAALIVGVLGSIVTVLHFMSGSQKYDALIAHSADQAYTQPSQRVRPTNGPDTEEFEPDFSEPPEGDPPPAPEPRHRRRKR